MTEINWQLEAEKWKTLSRKNETFSKLNAAKVVVLEAQLRLAKLRRSGGHFAEIESLTARIEKNQREVMFWARMVTELGNPRRPSKVRHRS